MHKVNLSSCSSFLSLLSIRSTQFSLEPFLLENFAISHTPSTNTDPTVAGTEPREDGAGIPGGGAWCPLGGPLASEPGISSTIGRTPAWWPLPVLWQRRSQPSLLAGRVATPATCLCGLSPGSYCLIHRVILPFLVGKAAPGRTVAACAAGKGWNRQDDRLPLCFLMKKKRTAWCPVHLLVLKTSFLAAGEQVKGEAR